MPETFPPKRARSRSRRTRAREFALQALYQVLVGKNTAQTVDVFTRDLAGFHKCQTEHYETLLYGCTAQAQQLDDTLLDALDRPLGELAPVEHAVLWIGCYEYQHCPDVPWRVVLDECIELAKAFGGTEGHKYVNGVLHRLAQKLRATEVHGHRAAGQC